MKEVIILYGGNSDEYEISEITANSIYQHIDKEKFSAVLVDLNDFKIKASKEKVFLISIPSQDVPFILESSFDCSDNTDMGFDFNFIQDDSPPAQTLIAPSSYQKSKNEEDKMAWLSKFCDKNISQSSLSEKFQIGDFFDENWAKDIDVTCLNKLS